MKIIKIVPYFLLAFALGCSSSDNNSQIEDGLNKTPNLQGTGKSANGFLSAAKYNSLIIEIFYVEGFRPNDQTINNLREFMEQRLNKPDGIIISETSIASPGSSPYDINEIADIENDIRTEYNEPGVLKLFMFFADGNFSTDTATTLTLGTAYRNTSCVLYENSIKRISNLPNGPNLTTLESTVILHELCHLLGLVDLGSAMQTEHLDASHGKHCDNHNCLMYWQTENNPSQMTESGIPQLDANCIADLQANGGK